MTLETTIVIDLNIIWMIVRPIMKFTAKEIDLVYSNLPVLWGVVAVGWIDLGSDFGNTGFCTGLRCVSGDHTHSG